MHAETFQVPLTTTTTTTGAWTDAPSTPQERLARAKDQIRACQRRARDALPAEVELGAWLLLVRDEQLYKLDGHRNIHGWAKEHHGIERTRVNTFLKVGASFTPAQVAGRSLNFDLLYQISLAPEGLRTPLLDLASLDRITSPAVMRRCCQAAVAAYQGACGEDAALAAAMQAARAARSPRLELIEQTEGAVRRMERLMDKIEAGEIGETDLDLERLSRVEERISRVLDRLHAVLPADPADASTPEEITVQVEDPPCPAPQRALPPHVPPPLPPLPPLLPLPPLPPPLPKAPPARGPRAPRPDRAARSRLRQMEAEQVRKLTSPLREIWDGSAPPLRAAPEVLACLLPSLGILAVALHSEDPGAVAFAALRILDYGEPELTEESPLHLYCRLLIATDAAYRRRHAPDYCRPLEIARVSTENPGLLPPEVHAHALHIAGLEHACAGRHREALACYRGALYVYDEKDDIDWQRLTHLLECMAWTLDQLGDSRAQDMRTRYHLSRMTLEEKQKRRKAPPS